LCVDDEQSQIKNLNLKFPLTPESVRDFIIRIDERHSEKSVHARGHDQTPPGVSAMERLKAETKYTFEETERGAHVRITTANADALRAVHEFLRFQIEDHQTGDPLKLSER
jgi:hypothetical protein